MSKKTFSDKDIKLLSKNKYVLNVSEKVITYTNEFKIHFIDEFNKGKFPREIFEESGFDIHIIGMKRINCARDRWKESYRQHGVLGLNDARKNNSGRPRQRELSKDEIIAKQNAQIEFLKAEVELLKKLELHERQVKNDRVVAAKAFELIQIIISKHNFTNMISYLCEIAGVSRSGYYNYISSNYIRQQRHEKDLVIKDNILKAMNHRGYKKGSRSIKMTLQNNLGINYNRKKIQRIMRKFNIVCPIRKANPYKRIAKATVEHNVVANLLNRNFKQGIPGKVLLTDITYLPFGNNQMAYLSTIKDASTNEILAYKLSKKITLDIATDTIHRLMKNPNIHLAPDAFIHSDQGSHYTSPIFQRLLKSYGLGQSMSRRGNCWDNAPLESFFGHMKDEVEYKSCISFLQLYLVIKDYMDYYNNHRYQWNLKKLTPVQYRNQLLAG